MTQRWKEKEDNETAQAELISAMTKTFEEANRNEEAVEDDISVYVNNMGRKLKKVSDEKMLVLVQNEVEQVIFRATMGMYDTQPPQSRQTRRPTQQNWSMYDNTAMNNHPLSRKKYNYLKCCRFVSN